MNGPMGEFVYYFIRNRYTKAEFAPKFIKSYIENTTILYTTNINKVKSITVSFIIIYHVSKSIVLVCIFKININHIIRKAYLHKLINIHYGYSNLYFKTNRSNSFVYMVMFMIDLFN